MKVFSGIVATVAAAALFPVMAVAQQPQAQTQPQGGRDVARQAAPARQVIAPLTAEQREQLRTFDEQQRSARDTARRELSDLNRQLEEELTAAQPNSARINELRSQIAQRETALALQRVDRLARVSSLLTPEQRQAMRERGGLGRMFGGGGRGGVIAGQRGFGGRGSVVARPREFAGGGRGLVARPGVVPPQIRGRLQARQPRVAPAPRGGRGGAGAAADEARLRAQIRRLEAQLEALRRRIR